MGYKINADHCPYIQVKLEGVFDKATALAALKEVFTRPDYPDKHTLWDFSKAKMGLTIQDMGEITGILKLYKPVKPQFANRVALVVKNRMELAMANVFIAASTRLPFDYKAFMDLDKARAFVTP